MTTASNSGLRRHQVQIQSADVTPNGQDEYGEEIPTWDTVRTTWASITTASAPKAKEDYQAGQFSGQVTHIINIRYTATPPIVGGMRVLFGSHIYLIQTVDNIDLRGISVNLMCLEINGAQ
jgi:SPP1 family predicted phage head-tail adaptor